MEVDAMKKLLSFILFVSFLAATCNSYVFAMSLETGSTVVLKEDYSEMQLDNETLFKKAKDGIFINNEYTRVTSYVQDDGDIEVINIIRKLDKEVFYNGEVVENFSSTSLVSVLSTGSKEETYTSGSYTFQLIEGFNYDKRSFDNGTTSSYKITNYYVKPVLLDSSFTFTNLRLEAVQNGIGYKNSGSPTIDYVTSYFTINNPVSNTRYSADTNFD